MQGEKLIELLRDVSRLTIFQDIKKHNCLNKFKNVLTVLIREGSFSLKASEEYTQLIADLIVENENAVKPVGTLWQNFILEKLITSDNSFTRQAERQDNISTIILKPAKSDLKILEKLFNINWLLFEKMMFGETSTDSLLDYEIVDMGDELCFREKYIISKYNLKKLFQETKGWDTLIPELQGFFKKWGVGLFAEYWVLKYNGQSLEGIPRPDPIRIEQLVGWDSERKIILDNTEQFVRGYSANNILLYGDRGTGKSSTVKGLIYRYADEGLRLVEVALDKLVKLPYLLRELAPRPQRFIIFIDDLSFEEYETQYKELKAVLEGGVEVQPENVLFYATSNRRHLVKEKFSDRDVYGLDDDEVRAQDTQQEKLSLSDRFGITVYFTSPAQQQYLEIVHSLADKKGIQMEKKELDRLALQWELMQNSRSGRTAKQFIDNLAGKLKLKS